MYNRLHKKQLHDKGIMGADKHGSVKIVTSSADQPAHNAALKPKGISLGRHKPTFFTKENTTHLV